MLTLFYFVHRKKTRVNILSPIDANGQLWLDNSLQSLVLAFKLKLTSSWAIPAHSSLVNLSRSSRFGGLLGLQLTPCIGVGRRAGGMNNHLCEHDNLRMREDRIFKWIQINTIDPSAKSLMSLKNVDLDFKVSENLVNTVIRGRWHLRFSNLYQQ